ncbi:MAG: ribokinase [Acidimicrobiales bacterium]
MPYGHGPGGPGGAVVVVGSLNYDHVVTVDQLPERGQTVSGQGYISVPGGKGLNQAVTASRLGAQVAMVGCLGDDPAGSLLRQVLRREGVQDAAVGTVAGRPSGTALITVEAGGANTIVVAAAANGELGRQEVRAARPLFGPASVVLAQLEVPGVAVEEALHLARTVGARTVLNPSPAPGPLPEPLLALVDVLVPNETEALAMTACSTPGEAAARLLAQGCGAVVVTLGEHGALVAEPGRSPVSVPAYPVQAVDTTAAGDAFCGALAASLAAGASLLEAVRRGCAAGAVATTVMGALPSLPTVSQVDRVQLL